MGLAARCRLDFSRPGKPTDNAFAEGFNSRVRHECLNAFWFLSLDDARCKIEAWRVEYNTVRPHSAIGHLPPAEQAQSLAAACCSHSSLKPSREPPTWTVSLYLFGERSQA